MTLGRKATPSLNENVFAGAFLIALGCFAIWLTSDLSQGNLSSMGAGFLPRYLGMAISVLGAVLFAAGLRSPASGFGRTNWRGLALVSLSVTVFALTIRPFDLGLVTTPGLGMLIAGPTTVLIAGYASPETNLRELLIIAFSLTAFSILLFADVLNLPLPVFPKILNVVLSGISAKLVLRVTTGLLVVLAITAHISSNVVSAKADGTASKKAEANNA
ncbi:tripartite tricarboxylate transporter TctB family protein [Agrobacterium tumefaciens]|uniref:tripartite tricarboxylate transporter TctB family protein n=1 Tax=Agrobacterium tumefaciens TaxID=358 RepID=UPI00165FCF1F|nr:tripartite tricarboxylate transporter TctB family protein [Agrobacterium tumefaciens]